MNWNLLNNMNFIKYIKRKYYLYKVKKIVSEEFGIKYSHLLKKIRKRDISTARFVYVHILNKHFMFSYKEIYKELNLIKHDGRIAYANNMVEKLSTIDKEFKHHFNNIIQKIKDENITRI